MIRLIKGGVVRIVETSAEAERFIKLGYIEEVSEAKTTLNTNLMSKTVEQLTELCIMRNINVPPKVKKPDLVSLLLENLSSEELEELS